ncbi:Hypothetical predicted protein [Marmota monax]|uniref:Uncharacterized protein n=1 Tax=Marmota monax TaxID=9995 RepID=A0A5E4CD60_MARMO|nr:hypothetical protein GHT09_015630 [Marmota monax]VTJ79783.1 Hypothetical predicted protein [Marmota monax]
MGHLQGQAVTASPVRAAGGSRHLWKLLGGLGGAALAQDAPPNPRTSGGLQRSKPPASHVSLIPVGWGAFGAGPSAPPLREGPLQGWAPGAGGERPGRVRRAMRACPGG